MPEPASPEARPTVVAPPSTAVKVVPSTNGHGLKPAPKTATAAFFDFDKTLLHGDAGVVFGRSLVEWAFQQGRLKGPLEKLGWYVHVTGKVTYVLLSEAILRGLYKLRILKRSQLVTLGYRMLKGFPAKEMYDRMSRLWESTLAHRLYPQMLEMIERHRRMGQRIVIVTTGLTPLIAHVRKFIGEDVEIIGCEMGEDAEGLWTGKVTGPLYGAHKQEAVREFAEANGVDLDRSYAYSDHFSDYHFLETVGNAIAVNPKRRLRRMARNRGWLILDVPKPRPFGF